MHLTGYKYGFGIGSPPSGFIGGHSCAIVNKSVGSTNHSTYLTMVALVEVFSGCVSRSYSRYTGGI